MKLLSRLMFAALGAVLLSGCGGSDLPEIGTVSGFVKNAGVPVKGSMVEFYPENGRPSMGRTDDTGKYVLYYNADNKGAKVGMHQVRVSPGSMVATAKESDAPLPPLPKPKKGEDVVTLPGKFEVKAGDNSIDLELSTVKS